MNQDKIKMREKLSFAMANFGNIPVMTLINGYLLIFYTNICGLSPAACATLFLIARFLDAINDPLVGFMIDHLPTRKMGHFRPTLILGTILCSANFLLLWFGPMLSTSGKLAIAYVSYILLGVLFPVMDISLNSLLPVMTEDTKERNSLSSIKGLAYVIGALVIGVAAPLILGDTCSDHDSSDFFLLYYRNHGSKRTCKTTDGEQLFCKRIIQDSQSEAGVHYIPCCTVIFDWKQYRECSKYILLYIYF